MTLTARILSQGDEIVGGRTLDTNGHWLAGQLSARGVQVIGLAAVADDPASLARLFAEAARDCELVLSSGGLGPTQDDHSAQAAAAAAGVDLEDNEVALAQVRERWRSFRRPMPESNTKQARLPVGCEVLENPSGTAPGFALRLRGARAFFLPGVPTELKAMFALHVSPWLEGRGLRSPLCRSFNVAAVGESALQDRLADLEVAAGVRLGFKTWLPYNSILLYAGPDDVRAMDRTAERLRAELGIDLVGEGDVTLPDAVGELLKRSGRTLAVAESCTAGGLGHLITRAVGSSAWFRGGVQAYANEVKLELLGVPQAVLEEHGAVSEEAAVAMAEGVRRRIGSEVGLSITGIAGPGGGSGDKPVGTVCLGMAAEGAESRTRTLHFGDRGRELVRTLAAASALEWLLRWLIRSAAQRPEGGA
jgi:nicotinamide-nucleotide amidase